MELKNMEVGQRVYRYVFIGGGGKTEVDNQALTVTKIAKVRVKVADDTGSEGWIHPSDLYPLGES